MPENKKPETGEFRYWLKNHVLPAILAIGILCPVVLAIYLGVPLLGVLIAVEVIGMFFVTLGYLILRNPVADKISGIYLLGLGIFTMVFGILIYFGK